MKKHIMEDSRREHGERGCLLGSFNALFRIYHVNRMTISHINEIENLKIDCDYAVVYVYMVPYADGSGCCSIPYFKRCCSLLRCTGCVMICAVWGSFET